MLRAGRAHGCDLVQLVFNHGQAAQDLAAPEHPGGHGANHLFVPEFPAPAVTLARALDLTHAHSHHFEQTALDLAGEVRVRLDPVDHHDPVGLRSRAVHERLEAFGGFAQRGSGHVRAYFGPNVVRAHAVILKNLALALGSPAPVSPHSGENEWLGALRPKPGAHAAHNLRQARDAPASGGNSNPAIAQSLRRDTERGEPCAYFRFQLPDSRQARHGPLQIPEARQRDVSVGR